MRKTQQPHRRKPDFELVASEAETDDLANLLTCDVARFEAHMAAQYADWPAFAAWVEERRWDGVAFDGTGHEDGMQDLDSEG